MLAGYKAYPLLIHNKRITNNTQVDLTAANSENLWKKIIALYKIEYNYNAEYTDQHTSFNTGHLSYEVQATEKDSLRQ